MQIETENRPQIVLLKERFWHKLCKVRLLDFLETTPFLLFVGLGFLPLLQRGDGLIPNEKLYTSISLSWFGSIKSQISS